jgi:hypothetical protein
MRHGPEQLHELENIGQVGRPRTGIETRWPR